MVNNNTDSQDTPKPILPTTARWAFIINPTAGGMRPQRNSERLIQALKQSDLEADIFLTLEKGHATHLTQQCIEQGFRRFVVVGGDGSLNEVVQGLMLSGKNQECIVTTLPWGTGNDWARHFGIPSKIKKFLFFLQQEKTIKQDIGITHFEPNDSTNDLNYRYFVNFVGCGFDSFLLKEMGDAGGNRLKYYRYLVKCLFKYQSRPMQVSYQRHDKSDLEHKDSQSLMTMACITQYGGGGMRFAPLASGHSGKLEFIDIDDMPLIQRALSLPALGNSKINKHPKVFYAQLSSVKIESEDPELFFQCDGELTAGLPIKVACIPNAINVICFDQ